MSDESTVLAVEFLNGSVEMTMDEARQIHSVTESAPFRLMVAKFLKPIEDEALLGLRDATFLSDPRDESVADQARVNLSYELSQIGDRIGRGIVEAEKELALLRK